MVSWDVLQRPNGEQLIHTKFVLNRKRDENEAICKHKGLCLVRGNEKESCQEVTFSPIAYHNVISLIFSLLVHNRWVAKHINFENAFSNGVLERTVYAEMPAQVFLDAQQ